MDLKLQAISQPVMGTAEVAAYMGVTRQAVANWIKRDKIIKPTRLRMGPVWWTEDIIKWAQEREAAKNAASETGS